MNIFCDFHHGGLYESLRLLFEERLGHQLFRPIGEEWFLEDYWKLAEPYSGSLETVRQFLSIEANGFSSENLNGINEYKDGIYYIKDPIHNTSYKAITLEKFREMDIDIVISSYQPHDITFAKLIKEYKPKAKHISQMGNIFQTTEVNNVLCSTKAYPIPAGKNVVFYHQEFDLNIFKPQSARPSNLITSFVNCLPKPELFDQYKSVLSEFDFKSYGISCRDGTINTLEEIGDIMKNSMFGWHIKPDGDGFGHIIHNWYACGRPVITNFSDYQGKLAGELLTDGITALNLEGHTFDENVERIKYFSQPDQYLYMSVNARYRFEQTVDFDKEAQDIKSFLTRLI